MFDVWFFVSIYGDEHSPGGPKKNQPVSLVRRAKLPFVPIVGMHFDFHMGREINSFVEEYYETVEGVCWDHTYSRFKVWLEDSHTAGWTVKEEVAKYVKRGWTKMPKEDFEHVPILNFN